MENFALSALPTAACKLYQLSTGKVGEDSRFLMSQCCLFPEHIDGSSATQMLLCAVVKRWKHTRRGTRRGKKRVEESIVFCFFNFLTTIEVWVKFYSIQGGIVVLSTALYSLNGRCFR